MAHVRVAGTAKLRGGGNVKSFAGTGAGGARLGREEQVDTADIDAETEQELQEQLKSKPVDKVDVAEVRRLNREQVKARLQIIPPSYQRIWKINLGFAKNYLAGKPLQLRVKFNSAQKSASGTFYALWQIGDPKFPQVGAAGTHEPFAGHVS